YLPISARHSCPLSAHSPSSSVLYASTSPRDLHSFPTRRSSDLIELLWQGMFRYPRWRGGPILNSAISAVEIALWDILGQALGVPVYKLLGGAARKRIRLYKDVAATPEAFLQAKEEGYTAAKSGFITINDDVVIPNFAVREGVRKLGAVRKAVGDDF